MENLGKEIAEKHQLKTVEEALKVVNKVKAMSPKALKEVGVQRGCYGGKKERE